MSDYYSNAYARFLSHVHISEVNFWNGIPCWEWKLSKDKDGYGRFKFKGADTKPHRFSYVHEFGAVPEGLEVDHLCRIRHCVNPVHLEAVTHHENCIRGDPTNKGNRRPPKTHCPQGHPYSGDNLYMPPGTKGVQYRQCLTCRRKRSNAPKEQMKFNE